MMIKKIKQLHEVYEVDMDVAKYAFETYGHDGATEKLANDVEVQTMIALVRSLNEHENTKSKNNNQNNKQNNNQNNSQNNNQDNETSYNAESLNKVSNFFFGVFKKKLTKEKKEILG